MISQSTRFICWSITSDPNCLTLSALRKHNICLLLRQLRTSLRLKPELSCCTRRRSHFSFRAPPVSCLLAVSYFACSWTLCQNCQPLIGIWRTYVKWNGGVPPNSKSISATPPSWISTVAVLPLLTLTLGISCITFVISVLALQA